MFRLLLSTTGRTATRGRAVQRAIPTSNRTTSLFPRSQDFPPAAVAATNSKLNISFRNSSSFSSENMSSNNPKPIYNKFDDIAASGTILAEEKKSEAEIQFDYFMKFAEEGNTDAMLCLGACYYIGEGTDMNKIKAFEWWSKSAEKGNAVAMLQLGACYDDGEGVAMNKTKAFDLYSKAAKEGTAEAMFFLGRCYNKGTGTDMNKIKAFEWWSKSAEKGNTDAMCALGVCYANSEGTGYNDTRAFEWWSKSAEQGNAFAKINLGMCYELWSKSAEKGHARSMFFLGRCYATGAGTDMNLTKAFEWWYSSVFSKLRGVVDYLKIAFSTTVVLAFRYKVLCDWR